MKAAVSPPLLRADMKGKEKRAGFPPQNYTEWIESDAFIPRIPNVCLKRH